MTTRIRARWSPPVLFAHRGAKAHAPDNTLEAFELAVKLGATARDRCVVHRDGEVVLDHDGRHRLFPRKAIAEVDEMT